jgi:hypothetical protein
LNTSNTSMLSVFRFQEIFLIELGKVLFTILSSMTFNHKASSLLYFFHRAALYPVWSYSLKIQFALCNHNVGYLLKFLIQRVP